MRDVEAIAARSFPVFARGLAIGACKKEKFGKLNEPVYLGGVTVRPGDVIVGTADGLVVLAQESVEAVLNAAIARRDREKEIFQQLAAGKTTVEILGLPRLDSEGICRCHIQICPQRTASIHDLQPRSGSDGAGIPGCEAKSATGCTKHSFRCRRQCSIVARRFR